MRETVRRSRSHYRVGITPLIVNLLSVAGFFIGLLVLWFVIYTAVRAALTSHRQAIASERHPQLP